MSSETPGGKYGPAGEQQDSARYPHFALWRPVFPTKSPARSPAATEQDRRLEALLLSAARLRHLTDPERADPFDAAETFIQSEESICEIASHLCAGTREASGDVCHPELLARCLLSRTRSPSFAERCRMFSDLSAAAESASRSDLGRKAITLLARRLRDAPVQMLVTASIGNGDGLLLPLEIECLRLAAGATKAADELAVFIHVGLRELRHKACGALLELSDALSFFTEMSGDDAGVECSEMYCEVIEDINVQLALLNRYGHALTRALRVLKHDGPRLGRAFSGAQPQWLTVPPRKDMLALAFTLRCAGRTQRRHGTDLTHDAVGAPRLNMQMLDRAVPLLQEFGQ